MHSTMQHCTARLPTVNSTPPSSDCLCSCLPSPQQKGLTESVKLYTAAINACMLEGQLDFDSAMEVYSLMQRNGVEPDDICYGNLIALAGR